MNQLLAVLFLFGSGCEVEFNASIQKYELRCSGGNSSYVMTVCDTKDECEKCDKDPKKCVKKKPSK
jgi:hypothetical protein